MTFRKQTQLIAVALLVSFVATSMPAFASGGLNAGTSAMTTFQTWLYSIAGVCATTYLTYKGIMAFTDREHWSDFGWGIVKVVVVGAVVAIAGWAFSLAA